MTTIQRSFAAGEIAPALYGRADTAKYATALRRCENFMVQRYGGVANRPGTAFVAEAKDSADVIRLVKFVFSDEQTYVLEFGDQYIRFIRDGAQLEDPPGTPYEIATPYVAADLLRLAFVQSGDTLTITHTGYQPRRLSRTGHTSWTLVAIAFTPEMAPPTACIATAGGVGAGSYRYRVTAVDADTLEESLPGNGVTRTITAATQANPCAITTSAAHGFSTGDEVTIASVGGMTQLNGNDYTITVTGATTFTLDGVDSTGYGSYTSGGSVARTYARVDSAAAPTSVAPIVVSWAAAANAREYYVYKQSNGVYGFIGTAGGTSFDDIDIVPDTSATPPVDRNPFAAAGDYPATSTYFQQRQVYAATANDPELIEASRSGNYNNFTQSSPLQDDDAISFALAGRQVNEVRHLLEVAGKLLVLTRAGEWTIEGDVDGVLKPTAINPRQQGYGGAATLAPVIVQDSAIYLQARGSVPRDLRFDLQSGGYSGRDLSIFAPHLFDGHTIVDWDFAAIPHAIMWAVRDDGVLLGLTYVRDQEVWGWHRHTTDGLVERVCVVPEGNEDAVYLVVRRTVDGSDVRYIERMASRLFTDIAVDAFFVDCGLTYDGRNATATTLQLDSAGGWDYTDTLTLTASASVFSVGDVGNVFVLTVNRGDDDEQTVRLTVTSYVSATEVEGNPNRTVPADLQSVATDDWSRAVDEVSGLDHLEGKTVSILSDGNVLDEQVVSSGSVPIGPEAGSVIHVGLPYTSTIETLDVDNPAGRTLVDQRKITKQVIALVEESRGIFVGADEDHLNEFKQRAAADNYATIQPYTGQVEVTLSSSWNDHGRIVIQQQDPLPVTVLAVAPSGLISGG